MSTSGFEPPANITPWLTIQEEWLERVALPTLSSRLSLRPPYIHYIIYRRATTVVGLMRFQAIHTHPLPLARGDKRRSECMGSLFQTLRQSAEILYAIDRPYQVYIGIVRPEQSV